MVLKQLQKIKDLIFIGDYASIKKVLENSELPLKGRLFEKTLELLYKGNGWLVSVVGGRSDAGADLLLFHPETPNKVSFIIQAKNQKSPLSFDDTKIELIKFEEQARSKYHCNNYKLISVNGFVENALKLEQFGIALYSWNKIKKLIINYNEKPKRPSLELVAHNKSTNIKINELFKTSNKVAVIQATGTGKSYLIGQCLIDFIDKNCLVLAPSTYILEQQKRLLPWLANVTYMTYAKASNITIKQWNKINPQLIVLDEFHRVGANIWGKGVERLVKTQQEAKVLGTTATHIRFLDGSRNMAEELFDNNVANEITLHSAIAKGILPSPSYITALYQVDPTVDAYQQHISTSNANDQTKQLAINDLAELRVDWEASSGIPDIFNKHLKTINGKYVVFCEDLDHLELMLEKVRTWFRDAGKKRGKNIRRYDYIVHSQLSECEIKNDLNKFTKAKSKNDVHLLFNVNMLNEGLHIKGVSGVILLRKTSSPIIYFQQIGRCLQVGKSEQPMIFDFVNNINNVQSKILSNTLTAEIVKEQRLRDNYGLTPHKVKLHIIDETIEIQKTLERIKNRLKPKTSSFETGFKELIIFKNKFGNCLVTELYKAESGFNLESWVISIQKSYRNGNLSQDKTERLDNVGFKPNNEEYNWDLGIKTLMEYRDIYGERPIWVGCTSPQGFDLSKWAKQCNSFSRSKRIPESLKNQLKEIGFIK